MTDRTELRKLAEAVKALPNNYAVGDDFSDAASPDVVLGLLDQVDALTKQFDHAMAMSKRLMDERGQLRAEVECQKAWAQQMALADAVALRTEIERLKRIKVGECDVGLCRSFEGERDQLRAVAVRLKGALERIENGCASIYAHDTAREALADPEVEKL